VAGSEIFRLNAPNLSIARAAALQPADLTLLHQDGTPQHVKAGLVTEGFFELFGLPMTKGGFTPDDHVLPAPPAPNAPPVPFPPFGMVISDRIWRTLYNSDPDIVGKPIRFAELQAVIRGVAPRGFDTPHDNDFWGANRLPENDPNHGNDGFMRIKRGADIEKVKNEMSGVIAQLGRDLPASARNRAYVVKPLVEQIVGDLGPILIIVMSATGLLLLLACVNVTNLLLARGAARAREMAVRVSLGAGRGRIVRQLLTESLVLAGVGSLLGILVAWLGVRGLMALGASKLPRLDAVTFDGPVLLFALGALLVTGVLVGFAPALRLARTDVRTLMNESSRSSSGGRGTTRWLSAMTVAEIALAIMLVAGAGWLVRGFANLRNIDAGFDAEKRLIFDVVMQGPKYPNGDAVRTATNDMIQGLRSIQGVTAVGFISSFPLRGTLENSLIMAFQGQAVDPQKPMGTRQRFVSTGLFDAMGHARGAGPGLRIGRRTKRSANRHREPRLREEVHERARSHWRTVRGRVSGAESAAHELHRRGDRRRAAEVARTGGGAGLLLALVAEPAAPSHHGRLNVAGRCGAAGVRDSRTRTEARLADRRGL
jgi:predicted permease